MMSRTIKRAIDTRLADFKIGDELENKILNNCYNPRKIRKRSFTIAAAVIICAMLSISVMGATITSFHKLLYIVNPHVEQFLQPIELTSEDNGVKMEVIAAMSDDDAAIAYISLQDLTADRVDKDIDLYNYSITEMRAFTSEVISYDEASKTAIIRLLANGGSKLNGKKATLHVDSFLSGKQTNDSFDTGIDLAKLISASTAKVIPLNMDFISGGGGDLFGKLKEKGAIDILKTDEMNIPLSNINYAHISNIGMIDGRLHVQTKWTGDGIDDHGTFNLINNLDHRIYPSNVYFGVDENGETKRGDEFVEYIFEINKTELNEYKLIADYFTTHENYTEGNWQVTFVFEALEKGIEVDCDINLDGVIINKMSVSPIGVTLIGTVYKKANAEDIRVSVNLTNENVLTLKSAIRQSENGKIISKYMPLEPIKLVNVKEITINDNIVELK
jgi:hypothetical protein